MDKIRAVEATQLKDDPGVFNVGDTVRVHYRVIEGKNERIQVFEGLVIAVKGEGVRKTFKVRKISYGVGVERTFPLHSPRVSSIEVTRYGRVRRAKLYYIRDRVGKSAKVAELLRKRKKRTVVPVEAPAAPADAAAAEVAAAEATAAQAEEARTEGAQAEVAETESVQQDAPKADTAVAVAEEEQPEEPTSSGGEPSED